MEIIAKPRKWGNSLAIILPKVVVDTNRIKENQDIKIEIKDNLNTAKSIFGMFPRENWRDAQEIKDEMRKGW